MEDKSNSNDSQQGLNGVPEEFREQLKAPEWVSRKYNEAQAEKRISQNSGPRTRRGNTKPPAPKKPGRRKSMRLQRLIALAAVLIICISGLIYAFSSGSEDAGPTVAGRAGSVNIMLLGVDKREGDAGRSDTLMVMTYNKDQQKASLMSLPRDTRVRIEGSGYDKINHAYAFGGYKLSQKTVESFLNVPMDYYVIIDIHAFEKIIDTVGGVDIDVEKRMYYEDPWDDDGGLVIDLYPGQQHMDGKTAIQYVRYRDGEGDIGRIQRQQKFMKALLAQVISPAILPKLPEIVKNLGDAVQTNMPMSEMLSLTADLPTIQQNGLSSEMVPGQPAYIKDISYWLPDIAKARQMIAQNMGAQLNAAADSDTKATIAEYKKSLPEGLKMGSSSDENADSDDAEGKKPAHEAVSSDITVLVINDSGINGAGAEVADILKRKGFKISSVETGNASREQTAITANEAELECFYGMPFKCTIMPGGSAGQATVHIGGDYAQ